MRQALDTCNDEFVKPRPRKPTCKKGQPRPKQLHPEELEEKVPNPYFLPKASQTNRRLLRLVRRRMVARFFRRQADHPDEGADVAADGAESDDDGRDVQEELKSDESGDELPEDAAARLREEVEIIRDELPTADGMEQLAPGRDVWDRATLEQRLSAAHGAPAAADVSLGPAPAGLHVDGVSVNPPRHDWHKDNPDNLRASDAEHFKKCWREWRKAGAAARGDGVERAGLDVGGVSLTTLWSARPRNETLGLDPRAFDYTALAARNRSACS